MAKEKLKISIVRPEADDVYMPQKAYRKRALLKAAFCCSHSSTCRIYSAYLNSLYFLAFLQTHFPAQTTYACVLVQICQLPAQVAHAILFILSHFLHTHFSQKHVRVTHLHAHMQTLILSFSCFFSSSIYSALTSLPPNPANHSSSIHPFVTCAIKSSFGALSASPASYRRKRKRM